LDNADIYPQNRDNWVAILVVLGIYLQLMSEIDQIGETILRTLETSERLSNLELAKRVGLSPSACLRRVQELERRGIIKGYRAVIDRAAIQPLITVFVMVGLSQQGSKDARAFERAMEAATQVLECHNIAGNAEYLLRVECGDLESYKNFHANVLGALPQIGTITSYFRLSTSKDSRNHLRTG